jgi:hypothetical protein
VPAIHTNIYYHPQTIAEVQRILAEHAALAASPPAARVGMIAGAGNRPG